MSLLVYNLTAAPLVLANGLSTTIPASTAGLGARGEPWYASGAELEGRSGAEYLALQAQQAAGLVAYEWQAFQEYNTYPLLVASAQTDIADLDLEIFADPVAGDDANPGTLALPVKTFQKAWTLGAVFGRRKRRIYLAAGTYPCVAQTPGQDILFYGADPLDEGEHLTVIGTPVDAGLGLLTATAVDIHTTQVSVAAHAPNSMIGATLRVVNNNGGGTAAGASCMVKADDGVILTLCNSIEWVAFGANMAVGDQLVLERPDSILTCDTNFGFTGAMCFKNVKADSTTGSPGVMVFSEAKVVNALNLELVSNEIAIINNSQFSPTAIGVIFYDPPPFSTFLESGGVYIHDTPFVIIEQGARLQQSNKLSSAAYLFRDCPAVVVHEDGVVSMDNGGGALVNSAVFVEGATSIFRMSGATDGGTEFSRATMDGSLGNALTLTRGAKAEFFAADISNATGDAIKADGGCFVSAGDLGGAGNGGYGLNLQASSLAVADNAGGGVSACTVTGTSGDVRVGASTKAYGALPFGEVDGSGPTGNRFSIRP